MFCFAPTFQSSSTVRRRNQIYPHSTSKAENSQCSFPKHTVLRAASNYAHIHNHNHIHIHMHRIVIVSISSIGEMYIGHILLLPFRLLHVLNTMLFLHRILFPFSLLVALPLSKKMLCSALTRLEKQQYQVKRRKNEITPKST